jgi:archaellum biogenesis protein FlaJ (TadC family)
MILQEMGSYCIITLKFGCTVNKTFIKVACGGHEILLYYHTEILLYCKQHIYYSFFCMAWDLPVLPP